MSQPAGRLPATRRAGPIVRAVARFVARWYLRRPDLEGLLRERYRSLRALVLGALNEGAYRLGLSRAAGLLTANFEFTNHCNLRCTFCPTGNGSLRRPRGFLDERVLERALRGAGRLEYALLFQWGEPLLHPRFESLARRIRRRRVRTMLTTNGTLLDERRVDGLRRAGVERVTVSVDGDAGTHAAVRGVPLARTEAGLARLLAARARGGPAVEVSMVVAPETEAAAAGFRRAWEGRVDRVQQIPLLTHGRRRTRCREPWRGDLVVLQDGRVTVCCVDHEGELALGDVRRDRLVDLYNGPAMQALRRRHACGDLPALCARCTEYPSDAAAPRFSTPEEASRTPPPRAPGRPARPAAARAARGPAGARPA